MTISSAMTTQTITIRKTVAADIPRLQEIFAIARTFMAETGNPHQWAADYPSLALLQQDIQSADSYVCACEGKIVGTFVLRGGEDPTYTKIYGGEWLSDQPYATIHRIASSREVKGIFQTVLRYALQHFDAIRIDTHADNKVMQQAVLKAGFQYCGIIHCWNGTERLAYQYCKPQ